MLPWSVIPTAGCPSAAAAATTSPIRDAPSSIEYSVWTCRWVNDFATDAPQIRVEFQRCNSRRPYPLARSASRLAPPSRRRHERDEHLGRRQRSVSPDELAFPGQGGVDEAHRLPCHERHVAQAPPARGGHRTGTEPTGVEHIVSRHDPGECA